MLNRLKADIPPLLLPLIAIHVLGGIALTGGRVTVSLHALQTGSSEYIVGVLIGLYGLLPTLFSIAVGRWADRVGPFIPIRAGIAALTLGIALAALYPSVEMLFVTATLCGLGSNIVTVAAQYAVGQLQSRDSANRVAHFGWFSLGQSTFNVVGPLVAGVIIDRLGYQTSYTIMAASACGALLLVLAHAPGLKNLHAGISKAAQGHRARVSTLIGTPSLRRIYIVGILLSIAWDIFTFLTPILGHRQHLSASVIGLILSSFAAGTFFIRMIMSKLSERFSEWGILQSSMVVIMAIFMIMPFTKSAILLCMLAFAFGAAVGCSQPNMLALLRDKAPPGRGAEAVGLRQMLCNASGVIVPFLFGATAASLGVVPVFWGMAGLLGAALPSAYREKKLQLSS